MKSLKALSTRQTDKAFIGDLQEGFHFNEKAPNSITVDGVSAKPKVLKPRHIEFSRASKKAGEASLYVCDDALTFCETHQIPIHGAAAKSTAKQKTAAAGRGRVDAHGFIHDDLEQGLAEAARSKRPVLVEFSAKWCPGCVRYEKEIFPTRDFAQATEGFVKVSIDTDRFENFATAEKFRIKGIPSMVVVNADGAEIDRLIDFQSLDRLKTFFSAIKADPTPIGELLARNDVKDPAERLRIGKRLLATEHDDEALAWLSPLQPPPPELLTARVNGARQAFQKDEKEKPRYEKELRAALKAEPESSRSLSWRAELVKLLPKDSPDVKTLVKDGTDLVTRLSKDDALVLKATSSEDVGEFAGYEKLLLHFELLDLYDAAGVPPEDTKALWRTTADISRAYHIPSDKAGPALRSLIVLSYAEMWPEAEAQANAILKRDPGNLDVQRRKIKILLGEKKYEQAAALGEKIIDQMIGRNQFWVAESLAKAYIGLGRKTDAKKLLQAYLARPEVADAKMSSSKRSLDDLLKTVQ